MNKYYLQSCIAVVSLAVGSLYPMLKSNKEKRRIAEKQQYHCLDVANDQTTGGMFFGSRSKFYPLHYSLNSVNDRIDISFFGVKNSTKEHKTALLTALQYLYLGIAQDKLYIGPLERVMLGDYSMQEIPAWDLFCMRTHMMQSKKFEQSRLSIDDESSRIIDIIIQPKIRGYNFNFEVVSDVLPKLEDPQDKENYEVCVHRLAGSLLGPMVMVYEDGKRKITELDSYQMNVNKISKKMQRQDFGNVKGLSSKSYDQFEENLFQRSLKSQPLNRLPRNTMKASENFLLDSNKDDVSWKKKHTQNWSYH